MKTTRRHSPHHKSTEIAHPEIVDTVDIMDRVDTTKGAQASSLRVQLKLTGLRRIVMGLDGAQA